VSPLRRYNPQLLAKLSAAAVADTAEPLAQLLVQLSVAEFRTAGFLLAESVLPALGSEKFWKYFVALVPMNSKAYLGTFLKAAVRNYRVGLLPLSASALREFSKTATAIDKRKVLDALLPEVKKMNEVQLLLQTFQAETLAAAAPYLLKAHTPVCYCMLFRLLRTAETDPETLRRYALQLISYGDKISFNLASIIEQYFDLKGLPATFSLNLRPYELSRLDAAPETFIKILKS